MGLWLRIVLVTWVVSVDPALVFASHLLTSALMYRSNVDRFSATYSYDAMSNLTSVKRRGIVDMVDMDGPKMESYGVLDDISISYDGNRISSVTAKSDAVAFEGMTGMGRNESDMSVSYDDAGRIVSDETRGITLIEYNNDGHPVRMVLDEGHEFHDAWDNFGNHLSTTIYMMQPSGVLNELPLLVKEYRGNGQIITSAPALGGHRHVMTRFAGGYFHDGEVYYYVTDYQGNNVAVVDGDGKIVEQTNYYPYGEPWREATEQPFLYAGNERLRLFGLNEYDFIARRYNPLLASFTTWDPLAEKYPWLSPYAYCAGNPINYIDPNGETVVFINGMDFGDGGSSDYWNGVDYIFMKHFDDYKAIYVDGSKTMGAFSCEKRIDQGYEIGQEIGREIINTLLEGESIKIVTHSMGGAVGKGFANSILDIATEVGIITESGANTIIEVEVDLAPYQPTSQEAVKGVPTIQISHSGDWIARTGLIKNAQTNIVDKGHFKAHSISTFTKKEIEKYVPGKK